jgi:hypothetical protein
MLYTAMKTAMLENLIERAAVWPAELRYLGAYRLSDDDRAALARSEENVRQGRYATEQEVAALFARYSG